MKNLAILIDRFGYNQKCKRICEEINLLAQNPAVNPLIFFAEYGPLPIPINFPIMELVKCVDFSGVFISTDFYTTEVMNNSLFSTKRYFYVWNMDYLYGQYPFQMLNSLYNNPKTELLARNQHRFNILKNTWKEPAKIVEEFNHKQIEALL